LTTLQLIDTRASLLDASRVIDEVALDKYLFIRDGYLTRRRSLVYDGDPPELPDADEANSKAPAAPK
jgi:phospholipid-binding lipoprotein MlaA